MQLRHLLGADFLVFGGAETAVAAARAAAAAIVGVFAGRSGSVFAEIGVGWEGEEEEVGVEKARVHGW